jgi:hypothetical protein
VDEVSPDVQNDGGEREGVVRLTDAEWAALDDAVAGFSTVSGTLVAASGGRAAAGGPGSPWDASLDSMSALGLCAEAAEACTNDCEGRSMAAAETHCREDTAGATAVCICRGFSVVEANTSHSASAKADDAHPCSTVLGLIFYEVELSSHQSAADALAAEAERTIDLNYELAAAYDKAALGISDERMLSSVAWGAVSESSEHAESDGSDSEEEAAWWDYVEEPPLQRPVRWTVTGELTLRVPRDGAVKITATDPEDLLNALSAMTMADRAHAETASFAAWWRDFATAPSDAPLPCSRALARLAAGYSMMAMACLLGAIALTLVAWDFSCRTEEESEHWLDSGSESESDDDLECAAKEAKMYTAAPIAAVLNASAALYQDGSLYEFNPLVATKSDDDDLDGDTQT